MFEDLREIPVIDPLATDLALYEMLGLIFRGNAKSLSKILREVAHGVIALWLFISLSVAPGIRQVHEGGCISSFRCVPG